MSMNETGAPEETPVTTTASVHPVPCECRGAGTRLGRALLLIGAGLRELEAGSDREREEGLAIVCGAVARRCAQHLPEAA